MKCAFTDAHTTNMKQLFEGKGAQVSTNKFAPYGRKMKNGLFLIASNEIPMCSAINHASYETQWKPFMARCQLVELKEDDIICQPEFPYTAAVLARALKH